MHKILKHIAPLALIIVGASACDSKLDVLPTQSLDENLALSTSQDIKVTLNGAYDGLGDGDVYGGGFQFTGEFLADDREALFGGTFSNLDEIWRKTITTGNTQTLATWQDSYSAINRANNVLSALSVVDEADRAQVEGEARFIRGVLYFELVKLWGKAWGDGDNNANLGVPLVTTPTRSITDEDYRTRASVQAVYAQVIDDLTKAESLLAATDAGDDASYATRDAATAMLSRVYLMQGNYALARDAANKVIQSGARELEGSFADVFATGGESNEIIFRTAVSDQDGVNSMNTYYAPATFQGRGDVRVQIKHTDLYEAGDVRKTFFTTASNRLFTRKFLDQFGDVPVVRLAEMYLTRAEANQRLGTAIGSTPLADVNRIRTRAGLGALGTVNLAAILKERKLELAFEGNQLDDIKRNKGMVGTKPFNDNSLVVPIPQREMDTNKSLVQNPGY
ncbi:RagB/SusD family nutrient uptake outer membrane protein [Haliscomenobacter hydrossis]|uniref:RagB/SusD domain-containing protein n=1 Tax=Haliscomenobacter hydrossis (strain ATCC 27775 / DSM 1100 / LMG 10767 / O) TaxID=760192 RepID=F4KTI9_HALH1|nr:RagB/SusD family nutrient uptake outer membrane protein [Haliscomenobacter hydrossis]AEE52403.1 RagB/SusD domain-containing protein [Haliscomenobacter hydrossis DSM 1100]